MRATNLSSIVLCALTAAACSAESADASAPSAPVTPAPTATPDPGAPPAPPLPDGVHELTSVDVAESDADLAAFDAIVGSTELVGLGETVHTSGGYHRMRERLVHHMIEKLGFRAVALETPWRTAEVATKYVETCEGSSKEASSSIFGVFASVQMARTFEYLCDWNKAHPNDKVSFWGYDIQDPWADGKLLRDFAKKTAPDKASLVAGLDVCIGVKYASAAAFYGSAEGKAFANGEEILTDQENASCKSAIAAVDKWLATDEAKLAAASSASEVRWAKLALDAIEANRGQYYRFYTDPTPSFESRDRGMASALVGIRELRSPGKRVVVIAHNTHLAHAGDEISGSWGGAKVMGQNLREAHKASYEAIALAAHDVKINWGDFEDPGVVKTKNAVENILFGLSKPTLLLDLQKNAVLTKDKTYELQGDDMVPSAQFRALVYLDKSEAMEYAPR